MTGSLKVLNESATKKFMKPNAYFGWEHAVKKWRMRGARMVRMQPRNSHAVM